MKRKIFILFFAVGSSVSYAQKNSSDISALTKLDLGLQGFGLTFERRLGKSSSIDLSTGIGTGGYDIWQSSFTYVVDPLRPTGYISITPKFYYNRTKRLAKGKTGELNSGNYVGVRIKYSTRSVGENYEMRDALLFNTHWGMQRAISKRWTLNSHFGIGYGIDATDLSNSAGSFYPALDFKFSYILNRPKS